MGITKWRAKQISLTLIILLTIINAYAELPNHPLIRNCIRNFFGRTVCFPEGHQFQQNLLNREQNPQDEECYRRFMQRFSASEGKEQREDGYTINKEIIISSLSSPTQKIDLNSGLAQHNYNGETY